MTLRPKRAHGQVTCKRGDVIVHHCLTIHRAGLNTTSDRHRRTVGFELSSVNVGAPEAVLVNNRDAT
jgi:ectoine hydroxylase-related dioxygenase (phytanoyl-CoA dioxygenase family)